MYFSISFWKDVDAPLIFLLLLDIIPRDKD